MHNLPSGWQIKSLGEVFTLKQGKHLSLNELNDGSFHVFGANGIVGNYDKYMYEEAMLLVTCRGATCGSINLTEPYSWVTGNAIALVPRQQIVNPFFYHQLKSQSFSDVISGSAQPQIVVGSLIKKKILVAPLPIQKQIAEILEKADQAKQKRKEANQLTEQFLQSAFIEMFGDPVKNLKGWKLDTLTEYFEIEPQNGIYKHSSDYGSGTRILRIDSFYDGKVYDIHELKRVNVSDAEKEKYSLKQNNIVINRVNSREYLGKCGLIPYLEEPVIFESNMMRFSVDESKLNPIYLTKLLITSFIKNQILKYAKDAVNQSSINQQDVKKIQIIVPPISLQQQFAELVEKTEALKEKQKQSEQELENLFNSLMQKAFNGELC